MRQYEELAILDNRIPNQNSPRGKPEKPDRRGRFPSPLIAQQSLDELITRERSQIFNTLASADKADR